MPDAENKEERRMAEIRMGKEMVNTKNGMGNHIQKVQDNCGKGGTYPPRAAI
jgi:hypothetical protein